MSTVTTTPGGAPVESADTTVRVRDRADVRRQVKLIVVFALALALVVYFWLSTHDPHVLFGERGNAGGFFDSGPTQVPTEVNIRFVQVIGTGIIAVALLLALVNRVPRGGLGLTLYLLVGAAFFTSFYLWNFVDQTAALPATVVEPFSAGLNQATPLILGALAGCLCERAGVINIAIEGQFLLGAFTASAAATLASHGLPDQPAAWIGLVGGALGGAVIAALLALFALRYKVDQVVLGVVLTAFATGLTGFFYGQIRTSDNGAAWLNTPPILTDLAIPGLSDIPFVGPVLFDQPVLVYVVYVAVVLVTYGLFQTRWGLRVRAVGEHPAAADTVGIKVNRMRWQAVLIGGLVAGIGGAYFTVGNTGAFQANISGGKGFIALAAVIMGRWHPIYATFAALFFGMMVSLQIQFTLVDPDHAKLFEALPYVAVIVAVAGFVGRVRAPAADGQIYESH